MTAIGVMKKFILIGLLVITTVFSQDASALPYSTYGATNGWAGYKNYKGNGFDVTVYFNVYDVVANPSQFNWRGDTEMPAGDRYIYAYQVLNNDKSSKDVGFFSVLQLGGSPVAQYLMHSTSSQSDGYGGIKPDSLATSQEGEWGWSSATGYVEPGKWSWFLIFSSDHAPIKGDFKVEVAQEGEVPIPEPATIALLGAAGVFCIARRNRKCRSA